MRLEKASLKAINYACKHFHYSKSVPANPCGYNVFNDAGEWCGVILYAVGANRSIASPYNLRQGQVIELVRVSLNGQQESTSKAVSISLRLIKKDCPLVKLIVSYADCDQDHKGIIYQATNWYYEGLFNAGTRSAFIVKGIKRHPKSIHSLGVKQTLSEIRKHLDPDATDFITKGKHKYIYPIDKSMIELCKSRAKPYPKAEIV